MVRYISKGAISCFMAEYKVRVSSKGRVVIPLEIREQYKISAGTELTLKPLDVNRLVVERVPRLSEFFGAIGSAKATKLLEQGKRTRIKG